VVALVYLTTTMVLVDIVTVPFQLALPVGFATAVFVHFTLQRLFVWVHSTQFALSIRAQACRYLLVVAVQYPLTAASIALLPGALGIPVMSIYFATALTLGATNFLVYRSGIFYSGA